MNDVLSDFQEDLRNGAGLWDCLNKYNLTLKQAFDRMHKPITKSMRGAKPKNINSKYIYRIGGYYVLQKSINGCTGNFGTYNTLNDAEKVRDYFIEYGWNHKKIDKVCSIVGVERRRR
jgi:hypothetical protein